MLATQALQLHFSCASCTVFRFFFPMDNAAAMLKRPSHPQQSWRSWVVQLALLYFIALHSIGLLHHHVTAAAHDACLACQVVDHQPLDVPDAGSGLLYSLLILLCLALPWVPRVAPPLELFARPQSRAPPSSYPFA